MYFQRIKTPGLAHCSYLFGDRGEAAVVDPRRDIDEYLKVARENDLSIDYVIETHRQEDFVLGSAELARVTGAKVINGRHSNFGRGDIRLDDDEDFRFASFRIRALSTPGHTPESMCYAVFIDDTPNKAWAVFTGDTLFIGETGRTDLPDPLETGENAGQLYDAIHEKLIPLGDQALLFPAHGAGSACGANIAERDDSTLGLERLYNPVFLQPRADFVAAKIDERLPRPPYFALMERWNLEGGRALAKPAKEVKQLQAADFQSEMGQGIVIDTRTPEAFAAGHIPDSYSIWLEGLSIFAGWVADAATQIYLVLPSMDDLEDAVHSLARIGLDAIEGVLAGGFDSWRDKGKPITRSGTTSVAELSGGTFQVLDVRDDREYETEGHVPGARHLYVGYLDRHLERVVPPLRKDVAVTAICSVGHRASLAASILLRHGYRRVDNVLGGQTAWCEVKLPTEMGASNGVTTPTIEGERR
jgi:hydroxyacylglutathione hydrolase